MFEKKTQMTEKYNYKITSNKLSISNLIEELSEHIVNISETLIKKNSLENLSQQLLTPVSYCLAQLETIRGIVKGIQNKATKSVGEIGNLVEERNIDQQTIRKLEKERNINRQKIGKLEEDASKAETRILKLENDKNIARKDRNITEEKLKFVTQERDAGQIQIEELEKQRDLYKSKLAHLDSKIDDENQKEGNNIEYSNLMCRQSKSGQNQQIGGKINKSKPKNIIKNNKANKQGDGSSDSKQSPDHQPDLNQQLQQINSLLSKLFYGSIINIFFSLLIGLVPIFCQQVWKNVQGNYLSIYLISFGLAGLNIIIVCLITKRSLIWCSLKKACNKIKQKISMRFQPQQAIV